MFANIYIYTDCISLVKCNEVLNIKLLSPMDSMLRIRDFYLLRISHIMHANDKILLLRIIVQQILYRFLTIDFRALINNITAYI